MGWGPLGKDAGYGKERGDVLPASRPGSGRVAPRRETASRFIGASCSRAVHVRPSPLGGDRARRAGPCRSCRPTGRGASSDYTIRRSHSAFWNRARPRRTAPGGLRTRRSRRSLGCRARGHGGRGVGKDRHSRSGVARGASGGGSGSRSEGQGVWMCQQPLREAYRA